MATKTFSFAQSLVYSLALFSWLPTTVHAFSTPSLSAVRRATYSSQLAAARQTTTIETDNNVCTIQILMSDTGGGHRASANALCDALDLLYPNQFKCDIVDIYTEYGPFWPYNDYVAMYKLMARYPITWDLFYKFGCTEFGMRLNEWLLTTFCLNSFQQCLARDSSGTGKRADMVVSVHPLCQDVPLKILAKLDSKGKTTEQSGRTVTPFCTVVTDLGGAHPTWFNAG
jgi:1,2-diacylglycerol 3-beta-galactosyltransferase